MPLPEINGHPTQEFENLWDTNGPPITITVCADCGQMRTVLWLSKDRWFCSACKTSGDERPTMIPLNGGKTNG